MGPNWKYLLRNPTLTCTHIHQNHFNQNWQMKILFGSSTSKWKNCPPCFDRKIFLFNQRVYCLALIDETSAQYGIHIQFFVGFMRVENVSSFSLSLPYPSFWNYCNFYAVLPFKYVLLYFVHNFKSRCTTLYL